MTFRMATTSDVDSILALMAAYYSQDGYEFVEADSRRTLIDLLDNVHLGQVWVVEDAEGVMGYLAVTLGYSLEYRGRDAFVDELFVHERGRGQGVGREALAVAEAYCRARGVRALHLEVEHHRTRALDLYRAGGFQDHDRRLMTKRLAR
jgi:ribosomal protein S18 acetylase RimI-like enzyme